MQKLQAVPDPNKFETHIEEGMYIQGDKNALILLISNLVENALKYAPKDSALGVTLQMEDKRLLCISDHGPHS